MSLERNIIPAAVFVDFLMNYFKINHANQNAEGMAVKCHHLWFKAIFSTFSIIISTLSGFKDPTLDSH